MRLRFIILTASCLIANASWPASATLPAPDAVSVTDSAAVRWDKGVEFFRSLEYFAGRRVVPRRTTVATELRWKTEWQMPESGNERIRQDGRWYFGVSRAMMSKADLWMAASGEHFDDRPYNLPPRRDPQRELSPRTPELETSSPLFDSRAATAVRILRAAGGVTARPWSPLTVHAGAGPVQDRRIGSLRSGFGLWTDANIEDWEIAGYEQSLSLEYNRETPRDHRNEDVTGKYTLFREFFKGNSNRAEIAGGWLGRDVYLDATGRTARREERHYAIRDLLTYGVTEGVRVAMTGEILHKRTEQTQLQAVSTALEENQAGFRASLDAERGSVVGRVELGLRNVSQTIRGEILQGRKTDLAAQIRTPAAGNSELAARIGVIKYSLDTRNPLNYDDRDELRYAAEIGWFKSFSPVLRYEWHGVLHLDHLVYLFRQNSANNRWSRFLLTGAVMRHRPSPQFGQTIRATVSANYQDYDFETDPQTTRSTVYRRFVCSDSAAFRFSSRWSVTGRIGWQLEEFGRLYWDSFEEERSDEIASLTGSAEVVVNLRRRVQAAAGALWDGRLGKRFASGAKSETVIFQEIESYGPMFRVEHTGSGPFTISLRGRALRQFQLNRDDRWIVTGEAVGGFRW